MEVIVCSVPHRSILRPLLFYVNDLLCTSDKLEPVMLDNDTNPFYFQCNLQTLFETVNEELGFVRQWFRANKLSKSIKILNIFFSKKSSVQDNIPLKLPQLNIFDKPIEKANSIKFLGMLLDENIYWKDHIHVVENKIAKSIRLLFCARNFFDQTSLKSLYFAYIHPCINYANTTWPSTHITK